MGGPVYFTMYCRDISFSIQRESTGWYTMINPMRGIGLIITNCDDRGECGKNISSVFFHSFRLRPIRPPDPIRKRIGSGMVWRSAPKGPAIPRLTTSEISFFILVAKHRVLHHAQPYEQLWADDHQLQQPRGVRHKI